MVIDQVWRMHSLFEILRPICDEAKRRANFLLLGSASPQLVRGIPESLAGRTQFIAVPGFSLGEVGGEQQNRLWFRGSFPRSFLAVGRSSNATSPASALERYWSLLSHWHGQVWNAAELGRALGASPATANRYRDIFAGTYIIRILQPWFENLGKRQVKAPKVYFRDSGLLHQFLGIAEMRALREHPRYGASWEGFALEQVLSTHGEADAPATTNSMRTALADLGLDHLWVVYPGQTAYPLDLRISALPLHDHRAVHPIPPR